MKTLVLLSALVLLAFQVQANPIQERDEQTKSEEQPGEEGQGVFSEGPEGSPIQDAAQGSPQPCRWCFFNCNCRQL
ncbi:alpha-defensin-related sequence 10-like [Mastomys coucha]|uniref:alpha-defensin-related sequence 10-like n=1 Tax=Mastomys coucha TaxID=35658 RepID=UPI0012624075|nr:alpha-defensin-related sequence 10-like [Mastomys coucha]